MSYTTTLTVLVGLSDRNGTPFVVDGADPLDHMSVWRLLAETGWSAGGFTLTETRGGWLRANGRTLVTERGMKVECVINGTQEEIMRTASAILYALWGFLLETDQESAMLHTPEGGWHTYHSGGSTERDDMVRTLAEALAPRK